jgi:hypothetical protein
MRKRDGEAGGSTLATECEAYLSGTLAEYWDEQGLIVPVWAWTNLLAHGSAGLIWKSVVQRSRPRRAVRRWRIARSYLGYRVLDLTDVQFTLPDLQLSTLIPLELEMAAQSDVSRWTPRQWVETIDSAIRNQHSSPEP